MSLLGSPLQLRALSRLSAAPRVTVLVLLFEISLGERVKPTKREEVLGVKNPRGLVSQCHMSGPWTLQTKGSQLNLSS